MSAPTPARLAAYETLRRVFEEEAWADRSLRSAAARLRLTGRHRAQAQALAYGSVQRRGTTDHFIERLAGRQPAKIDPPLLAALRLGMYELLFATGDADHAAVDQAVALAKGPAGRRRGSGLVNAVLRRAARERPELLGSLGDADPAAAAIAHSVPRWLAELWWEELGPERARALLGTVNLPPERAFRVNGLRGDPAGVLADLRSAGVEAHPPDPGLPPAPRASLVVEGGAWEAIEAAVEAGVLVPQSRGSAAVVETLAPQAGERVLDLCAGPGVKATQIAAELGEGGAGLVAVERDPGRAGELRDLCERAGASGVEVLCADATAPPPGRDFDAILVDPPCSGLGTLASRPDARWRRSPESIDATAELAGRILERAGEAVRTGGRIVYSTCTISRRENSGVIAAAPGELRDLGAAAPELALAEDPRCLQTLPNRDRTDGFFIAELHA